MCTGAPLDSFPAAATPERFEADISGYRFDGGGARIAILPDIYGCSDFYRGLSTHLMQRGRSVYLVDPFDGLGDLPEVTREAAFARRHKVRDKTFLDAFENFAASEGIAGVIGFCLGGCYVFELARRGFDADLLGLYGFPQGLENQDPLPKPFDYLETVQRPFTMLLGREDAPVGPENVERLEALAPRVPAMTLKVYDGVGHNFLSFLDSDAPDKKAIAREALSFIEAVSA